MDGDSTSCPGSQILTLSVIFFFLPSNLNLRLCPLVLSGKRDETPTWLLSGGVRNIFYFKITHRWVSSQQSLVKKGEKPEQGSPTLTGIVPPTEAFGLAQCFHVSIHVALGALLLWGDDKLLALHVCPPGDVLRGTAGHGLLQHLASAVLAGPHLAAHPWHGRVHVLRVPALSAVPRPWDLQNLQLSDVTCPKNSRRKITNLAHILAGKKNSWGKKHYATGLFWCHQW